MEAIFLPALGESTFRWIYQIQEGKGESWDWPCALLSYHYWGSSKRAFPPGLPIFGDSGGFSVVTQGAQIDPVQVMKWQLRVCRSGVILDRPPYSASGGQQFAGSSSDLFQTSLATTVSNVRRALPFYTRGREDGSVFRWYGVMQGDSREQIQEWYRGVCNVYAFEDAGEGWAVAPKPSTDVVSIAKYLGFARDMRLRRLHVLQVTSAKPVAVLLALAYKGEVEHVTYDSATAALYAANHKILIPHPSDPSLNFTCLQQQTRKGDRQVARFILESSCTCLGCKWFRNDHVDLPPAHLPKYLLLHNYLFLEHIFGSVQREVAQDPDTMLRWAVGNKLGPVLRAWTGKETRSTPVASRVSIFNRL